MIFRFIDIQGYKSVRLKGDANLFRQKYASALRDYIRKSAIHSITTDFETVKFRAPLFRFVWNGFNMFNPVSKGIIQIKIFERFVLIKYRFWFWEFFAISLLFSSIIFFGFFPSVLWRILFLAIIWIIYLINILLSVHRISIFLKKTALEIIKSMQTNAG